MGDVGYMSSWVPYNQDGVGIIGGDLQQRLDVSFQQQAAISSQTADHMAGLSGHLSHLVRALQGQNQALQLRVTQLEDWKRNTSQEMRKLRAQHESAKRLLAQLNGEADDEEMKRAVSLPTHRKLEQHGVSTPSQGWMTPTSSRPAMEHSKSMTFVPGFSPPEGLEELLGQDQPLHSKLGRQRRAQGSQLPQAVAPVGQQKAPVPQAATASSSYKTGDTVEVWSCSSKDWLVGEVTSVQGAAIEVAVTGQDGAIANRSVDAGSAEIRQSGNSEATELLKIMGGRKFRVSDDSPLAAAVEVGAPPGLCPVGLQAFGQGSQSSSLPSHLHLPDESAAPIKDGIEVKVSEDCMMTCVEWRIAHMSKRLKDCMGRPLVSSPFNAWDIQGMLLMICPDCGDGSRGRTKRQKQLYNSKVNEGSMHASVKLKVADCPHELTYHVEIGDEKRGPFKHNFAVEGGSIVSSNVDLGIDFLSKLESDGGLLVRVSIMAPKPVRELGSQATI